MKILYIFPHPDDESFGPAPVMYRQVQQGHEVYLLTLTKGGATKQRFKYGLSIDEMGEVRFKEMLAVEKILGLTEMTVLNLEDGEMAQLNSEYLEQLVEAHILRIKPDLVVTYAVHGISCHHDHLTIHATIKNLFSKSSRRTNLPFWKRLAFFTLPRPENTGQQGAMAHVHTSATKYIDCIVQLNLEEQEILRKALYCYESFVDVIESTNVINTIGDKVHFEIFNEDFKPVLEDLTEQMAD